MSEKIKLALIATYSDMADIFLHLAKDMDNVEAISVYASFETAVQTARQLIKDGKVDVILGRGGTAAMIKNAVDIPVVFIPITPFDVQEAVWKLSPETKKTALIHYRKNIYGVQKIAEKQNISIKEYTFRDYFDISNAVKDAKHSGIQTIIGGEVGVRLARVMGMQGQTISSCEEAVERAINEAVSLYHEKRKEQKKSIQLRTTYNSLKEGIIVTDEGKRIIVINPIASRLFGDKYKVGDIAGPDIVSEECSTVYETQKEVPVYFKKYSQEIYAVRHIPILHNGRFIGVVSRMEDVTKTQELEQKIRKELHQKGFVAKYDFSDIITQDERLKRLLARAKIYASTDSVVLIEGESGTGKELLAQSIHNNSKRKEGPFVAVNCSAIPENLLESELFGYEPGAFTGAKKEGKTGLFEMAHGGTLFLDEIGELSKNVQTRLLRVLQEKEIMRVGGNKIIPIDVRIISATNQNLKQQVEKGVFRRDLFYRLNVLHIVVPPLRDRNGDVVLLAETFMKRYGADPSTLSSIIPILQSYNWPGNIRELRNVIERFAVLQNVKGIENFVNETEMPEVLGIGGDSGGNGDYIEVELKGTLDEMVNRMEHDVIRKYLEEYKFNQEFTAKALGISKTTLWRKYK